MQPNGGTIPKFAWRDGGNSGSTSVTLAGVLVDIRTRHLSNMSVESYLYASLLGVWALVSKNYEATVNFKITKLQ
jgi:hypothetical protein